MMMLQGHVEDSSDTQDCDVYGTTGSCHLQYRVTRLQYLTGVYMYIPRSTLQDSSFARSMTHVILLI